VDNLGKRPRLILSSRNVPTSTHTPSLLPESKSRQPEEISHFEAGALVTTCKLVNPVSLVWKTKAGNARLDDLGRAERTGH
jgi:hypothetical protein